MQSDNRSQSVRRSHNQPGLIVARKPRLDVHRMYTYEWARANRELGTCGDPGLIVKLDRYWRLCSIRPVLASKHYNRLDKSGSRLAYYGY